MPLPCTTRTCGGRRKALHRRLLFMATCMLLDAPLDRFDFIFNHDLGFPFLDLIIGLGVVRDLVVNRRINRVYLMVLPVLIVFQAFVIHTWHSEAGWWVRIARGVLG
jgi:hypothetical protein